MGDTCCSFLIYSIPLYLLIALGYYKLFEKAGEKGWKGFVPLYNFFVILKIIGKPAWWIIFILIPLVNLFAYCIITADLLKSFGKNRFHEQALAVLFGFFYLPYLGFKKEVVYLGPASTLPKVQKTPVQEWTDAILFAVIAATLIRWAFLEAFVIPTPSMEKSLLVGDYLFVSKINYGPRTPKTPLQVPLTHQKIWLTDIPSYSTLIQLPQYRFPGLQKVKNNDVVVFNYPNDNEYPTDLKTNYIKRCMGIAGDSIEVRGLQVYVNGKPAPNPPEMQFRYFVFTDDILNERFFRKMEIAKPETTPFGYVLYTTEKTAQKLRETPGITKVEIPLTPKGDQDPEIFPNILGHNPKKFIWNKHNFGPLWIPKKGATIKIDSNMVILYGSTIIKYENLKEAEIRGNSLVIDGKEVKEYTFRQNYYFMMGDNRDNSADSRYWGFVPEDHIVGKALFIWMSKDPNPEHWYNIVRWNRLFNLIK
jgi:signal peptidase I